MSSITTIRVNHSRGFVSKECLEQALEEHGFSTMQSNIIFIEKSKRYVLSMSGNASDEERIRVSNYIQEKLDRIVQQILPTYTRLLAIKDFEERNFHLKREKKVEEGLLLVFEKSSSIKEGGDFKRIIVTIRNDNTLTIDAVNFSGKSCLNATKPFETKIGSIVKREMKPEAKTKIRRSTKVNQRQRLRL